MSDNNKIFAKGFYFKRPATAPAFVVGQISIKASEAIQFIQENQNNAGYVNLDIKNSRDGKYYIELNQYEQLYTNTSPGSNES